MSVRYASTKQFSFIKSLLAEREVSEGLQKTVDAERSNAVRGVMTAAAASGLIEVLLAQPKKGSSAEVSEEIQAGIYSLDDKMLVRVYHGQQFGHMLVKSVEIAEDGSVSYEYQGAASRIFRSIANPNRPPLEEVGKLGIQSGTCLNCGRRLDDPLVAHRGFGPVF